MQHKPWLSHDCLVLGCATTNTRHSRFQCRVLFLLSSETLMTLHPSSTSMFRCLRDTSAMRFASTKNGRGSLSHAPPVPQGKRFATPQRCDSAPDFALVRYQYDAEIHSPGISPIWSVLPVVSLGNDHAAVRFVALRMNQC